MEAKEIVKEQIELLHKIDVLASQECFNEKFNGYSNENLKDNRKECNYNIK